MDPTNLSDHELLNLYYGSSCAEENANEAGTTDDEITSQLDNFVQTEIRSKENSSVEFWNKKKDNYPKLFVISEYLNSIPPTQVTIERSFSSLSKDAN